MQIIYRLGLGSILLFQLLIVSSAYGVDGVIEINQARALAGGITPGDAAGYPVQLTQPGSYRLTSNLIQPNENTNVVQIESDNIAFDLNGFAIQGSTTCSGSGASLNCNPTGSGVGIRANTNGILNKRGVTIKNGTIFGMGGDCIDLLGGPIVVTRVTVRYCGGDGINVFSNLGGEVSYSSATLNDGVGIATGNGARVLYNSAVGNKSHGIRHVNGFAGLVKGNTAYANGGDGLQVSFGSGALVLENASTGNTGFGLSLTTQQSAYGKNMLRGNNGSNSNAQISTGTDVVAIDSNFCGTNLTCP